MYECACGWVELVSPVALMKFDSWFLLPAAWLNSQERFRAWVCSLRLRLVKNWRLLSELVREVVRLLLWLDGVFIVLWYWVSFCGCRRILLFDWTWRPHELWSSVQFFPIPIYRAVSDSMIDLSMSKEQRPGRLGDTATQHSAHELKCRWRMRSN